MINNLYFLGDTNVAVKTNDLYSQLYIILAINCKCVLAGNWRTYLLYLYTNRLKLSVFRQLFRQGPIMTAVWETAWASGVTVEVFPSYS